METIGEIQLEMLSILKQRDNLERKVNMLTQSYENYTRKLQYVCEHENTRKEEIEVEISSLGQIATTVTTMCNTCGKIVSREESVKPALKINDILDDIDPM